jgi:hypothetical protein
MRTGGDDTSDAVTDDADIYSLDRLRENVDQLRVADEDIKGMVTTGRRD